MNSDKEAILKSKLSVTFPLFCQTKAWCLKTTEKVSFDIVSEASYVYNLSGQKLIKNAENIWAIFDSLKLTVTRQVSFN